MGLRTFQAVRMAEEFHATLFRPYRNEEVDKGYSGVHSLQGYAGRRRSQGVVETWCRKRELGEVQASLIILVEVKGDLDTSFAPCYVQVGRCSSGSN